MTCRDCAKKPFLFLRELLERHPDDETLQKLVNDAPLRDEGAEALTEDR